MADVMTRAALRKGCPSCGEEVRTGQDVEGLDTPKGVRWYQVSYLVCPWCGLTGGNLTRRALGLEPVGGAA